jgi:transcriptional regulator with XRE-family HTH domain
VGKRLKRKNIIGHRVAEARSSLNPSLTQDALSGRLAKAGVRLDRAAIAKIENNLRRVTDYEAKAIAEALGVSIEWLFEVNR